MCLILKKLIKKNFIFKIWSQCEFQSCISLVFLSYVVICSVEMRMVTEGLGLSKVNYFVILNNHKYIVFFPGTKSIQLTSSHNTYPAPER